MRRVFFLLGLAYFVTSSQAVSLRDSVEMALVNNPNIVAERKNQEAYKKYIDEREGRYLPTLDLEAYLSKEKVKNDRDSVPNDGEWLDKNGYNVAVIFRQYLYDGGLTPSQVSQTKHQELMNRYRSYYSIDNTILETAKTYNALVESDEKLYLTAGMIKTNEHNLIIAKEKEEISGEVLETYQVSSKLNFVTDRYIDEQDKKEASISQYIRYVGVVPEGKVCRPVIDEAYVPKTLEDAIKSAVLRNHKILQQIEKIKIQREKIAQANANFLPSLNLELKASYDKDLKLDDDGVSKDGYARLNFQWNLFNGNRDSVKSEQEKIFLQEQKKTLDEITNEVIADVKSLYKRHFKYKERIKVFKKYVEANMNIVEVYRNEFESGTRTFVDILNAESEFYESSKNLIVLESSALNNYYDLMFNLSKISDVILASSNQDCALVEPRRIEYSPEKHDKNTEEKLNGLISENDSDLISNELSTSLESSSASESKQGYDAFLDAPKNYYTINVATKNGLSSANKYVRRNNLEDKAIVFEFGPNMKNAKVLYGIYGSIKDAKTAMKNLTKEVLSGKPYVDNIRKHQALYLKYN